MVFLTALEQEMLLAECRRARNKLLHPYVVLLLQTAMRPSEAAGLLAGQVDLDRRLLRLDDTKNGERRVLPLTDTAVAAVGPVVAGKRADQPIFLPRMRKTYQTIPSQAFRESFRAARRRAGLPHLHLHDLRHTAASRLIMAGVDLRTLAAILGHRTLQMVMRYTHLNIDHLRAAVGKLG